MIGTTIRAFRKWKNDGVRSTLNEAINLLAESHQVRSVLRPTLFNDINYLDYEDLVELTEPSVSRWEVFQGGSGDNTIGIPRKVRISSSTEFHELPVELPYRPWVFELKNSFLVHPFGVPIWNGSIVKESISPQTQGNSRVEKSLTRSIKHHSYQEISKITQGILTPTDDSLNAAVSLIPVWNNYYHWTIECLPRLAAVERYQNITGINPTILIPEDAPSWMTESLRLAGIEENQYTELTCHTAVDRLVVPSYPQPTQTDCKWIKDNIQGSMSSRGNGDNQIYVTRRNATRRRIKNEDALLESLQKWGFKSYALEEISVSEQIELFSSADTVIAPHGAGLANIVYSDEVTVIELFGESKKTTFYRLAKLLEHEYHYLMNNERYGDLTVDLQALDDLLGEVLGEVR